MYWLRDLFRPRNLVPALVAALVAGGWLFFQRAPEPAGPEVQAQAVAPPPPAPEAEPAPAAEPPPEVQRPEVLVATRPIEPGVLLGPELVEWRETEETVDLGLAVVREQTPLDAVLGSVAIRRIAAGEQVTWARILLPGRPGFLTSALEPGYRALTIEVDQATTAASLIYPGDHVDVIMVYTPGSGGVPVEVSGALGPTAQTIARDLRVIAVGNTVETLGRYGSASLAQAGLAIVPPAPPEGETFTLEARPRDAERIALAAVTGRLTLAIRSLNMPPEAGPASGSVGFHEVMPGPGPYARAPEAPKVRVLRGSTRQRETVVVSRGTAEPQGEGDGT